MIETQDEKSKSYKSIFRSQHKWISEDEVTRYKSIDQKKNTSSGWKYFLIFIITIMLLLSGFGWNQINLFSGMQIEEFITDKNGRIYLFSLFTLAFIINIIVSKTLHHFAYMKVAAVYNNNSKETHRFKLVLKEFKNELKWYYLFFSDKCPEKLFDCLARMVELEWKEAMKIGRPAILFILSPDRYFAEYYKERLSKNRIRCESTTCYRDTELSACAAEWDTIRNSRKFFIEFSNWYNVNLTVLLTILVITLWEYNGSIIQVLHYALLYRLVSRAFEIGYAYYTDIVQVSVIKFRMNKQDNIEFQHFFNGWKKSSLRRSGRISLAVHTLFEMILLYSTLYYFEYLFNFRNMNDLFNKIIGSLDASGNLLYFNFFLHSLSVSSFNISFGYFPTKLWLFLHASQVLISMVLIILSLATYLGTSDDVTEREEDFFKRTLSKK